MSPWSIEVESELFGEARQNHLFEVAVGLTPRQHYALEDADARIAEYELFAHLAAGAEPTAGGARSERGVERKVARLELGQGDAALGTAIFLGEQVEAAIVGALNFDQAFRQLEGSFNGIVQASAIFSAHDQTVDDHRNSVVHPAVELGRIGDLDQLSVHDRPHESLLPRGLEQLPEFSFAATHEWRENLDLRALRPGENGIGNLSSALPVDWASTVGTVRSSGAGVQKPEVIVDLGDGADGRSRVVSGTFLFDRDRGR